MSSYELTVNIGQDIAVTVEDNPVITAITAIGPQGPTGPTGPANSLSIGTVTTVAAGGSATASVTGTPPAQTLNLGIPRGDTGAQGPTGTGGALGLYGAFSDYTTQTATANTATVARIGTTDESNGVTVVSGTRVTVSTAGTYDFQWSGQYENPNASDADVYVWLRKNGTDVVGSTGLVSIPGKHGAINGHVLPAWNYVLTLAASDYLELVWATDTAGVQLVTYPAGTAPTRPSTASLVVTVTQVMYTQLGPTGPIGPMGDWSAAQTLNAQTGTSYTLVSTDVGKLVTLTNAAAVSLTIPAGLGWTAGQRIDVAQLGAGQVTFNTSGGASLVYPGSALTGVNKLRTQYSTASIICTATNAYLLVGDLAAPSL